MEHADATHVTPADRIIGALAFASGSADVFAFLKFHDVFTSAMTGNTALLGLALGRGHVAAAVRSLIALVGFSVGCVCATLIDDRGSTTGRHRLRRLLGAELAGLVAVALGWALLPRPVGHLPIDLLIGIGAWAMGVQSIAARAIDLPGLPTVVFTSTLSTIMVGLTRGLLTRRSHRTVKPITVRQIGAFGIYVSGAALSGLLAVRLPALIALPAPIAVVYALAAARSL